MATGATVAETTSEDVKSVEAKATENTSVEVEDAGEDLEREVRTGEAFVAREVTAKIAPSAEATTAEAKSEKVATAEVTASEATSQEISVETTEEAVITEEPTFRAAAGDDATPEVAVAEKTKEAEAAATETGAEEGAATEATTAEDEITKEADNTEAKVAAKIAAAAVFVAANGATVVAESVEFSELIAAKDSNGSNGRSRRR